VNAVAPGRISTEMTASRQTDPAKEARTNALIPLGRSGQGRRTWLAVICWAGLAGRGGTSTGQVIPVDGAD